jgi:signal transduction histidine kinase
MMNDYFVNEVIGKKIRFDKEYRIFRNNDQAERWVYGLGKLEFDSQGQPLKLVGTIRDVTERKRAEEELRRHLSELKVLYDNGLAISALQEPYKIGAKIIETLSSDLSWHHIAIRLRRGETDDLDLIAFSQSDLDGETTVEMEKHLSAMVGKIGQGLSGWSVQTGRAIRTGNVQEYPQYVDTYSSIRSGMYMPLTIGERVIGSIAVESEEENAFTEQDERLLVTLAAQTAVAFENARLYQNIQWELEERLRMEEKILQLNASLEQRVQERTQELRDAQDQLVRHERLALLGQLAGSVGHELRNPLGVISNAVYFLKVAQPDAGQKIKEYLDIIEKEAHASDKIITDLLDFTRIKSMDRQAASVPQLIHQALKRFPMPESVLVTLDLPEDLPRIYADPQHVVQVLGNLIINAYQSMPKGGKLTVSSYAPHAQEDMICITVQDSGVGISPENIKKLFEPLFTTKTKGIGLGLAVSQKLIEANGGRIEVHSEVGVGSAFCVYLPIYRSE